MYYVHDSDITVTVYVMSLELSYTCMYIVHTNTSVVLNLKPPAAACKFACQCLYYHHDHHLEPCKPVQGCMNWYDSLRPRTSLSPYKNRLFHTNKYVPVRTILCKYELVGTSMYCFVPIRYKVVQEGTRTVQERYKKVQDSTITVHEGTSIWNLPPKDIVHSA